MENTFVSSFKNPSFQERIGNAAEAKKRALEQLRSKPPIDERIAAERQEKSLARQAKIEAKSAARKAALQADKEARVAKAEQAKAKAAASAPRTEAELKAARDARYAARKARK